MTTIVSHPRTYATVTGTTGTFTTLDGLTEPITTDADEDIRHAVLRRAAEEARHHAMTVELVTSGDRGAHHLLVDPDGDLTPIEPVPAASIHHVDHDLEEATKYGEEVSERTPQPAAPRRDEPEVGSTARPTFLTTDNPSAPRHGWLGRLGIKPPQSVAKQRRAELQRVVARQWAGCRTLAIANGKGGVGKTMTTAMLAAVYAREGGGNVLAWDNNDTRGTLGWRTEQGLYATTLRDLLPAAPDLLAPDAGVADIAQFVHHQTADRYDVLRSNPELLATDQHLGAAQFDLLMQVAARYYRLVVFDSGNDESAERWLRMIDSSFQLVIPTLATPESAESASLLLDALRGRDHRSAALAARAVVIVTQSEPSAPAARRIADGFEGHVRAVHVIPFDPALKAGQLRFEALRRRTRDSWLASAAAAAEGL